MADAFPFLTQTTSSTTGTGALVLDTAALSTYLRTPKQAVADGSLADGDYVYYSVIDKTQSGDALFEVGYGQYSDSANTITRSAGNVIDGSNGPGVLVSLPGSGVRDVLILDHVPQMSSQVSGSNALRIAPDGDVGLGTSTPVAGLDIRGSIECPRDGATDTLTRSLTLGGARNTSAFQFGAVYFENYDSGSGAADYVAVSLKAFNEDSDDSGSLAIEVSDSQVAREVARFKYSEIVLNDGGADCDFRVEGDTNVNLLFCDAGNDRVGIGTNAPGAVLDVRGSVIINEDGGDNDLRVEGDTDTNLLYIDASTDRVGIGTNTPGAKLDVRGSVIFNEAGGDNDFRVEGTSNANLLFVDASVNSVGIGTNSPGATLEVVDGAIFSGSGLAIVQIEDTSTTDPRLLFSVSTQDWVLGIDNSDGDKLKLQTGQSLSATSVLSVDAATNPTFEFGNSTNAVTALKAFMATEDLEFKDAGSVGATNQDWIEVTVGGNTGYIRVFATK